ncbi:hypothetical protein [Roseibium sp. M-1]
MYKKRSVLALVFASVLLGVGVAPSLACEGKIKKIEDVGDLGQVSDSQVMTVCLIGEGTEIEVINGGGSTHVKNANSVGKTCEFVQTTGGQITTVEVVKGYGKTGIVVVEYHY